MRGLQVNLERGHAVDRFNLVAKTNWKGPSLTISSISGKLDAGTKQLSLACDHPGWGRLRVVQPSSAGPSSFHLYPPVFMNYRGMENRVYILAQTLLSWLRGLGQVLSIFKHKAWRVAGSAQVMELYPTRRCVCQDPDSRSRAPALLPALLSSILALVRKQLLLR